MSSSRRLLAFTGSFTADHHTRALDAVCARLDGRARDILCIVASGAGRRRVVGDLLSRRGAVFGLTVKTMRTLPAELFRRAGKRAPDTVAPLVADLLAERELRSATAGRFDGDTPVQGLARAALAAIDLLERQGGTSEQLTSVIGNRPGTDGPRTLARAWYSLTARRERLGSSDTEVLSAAAELLHEHPEILRGIDAILVEDLSAQTTVERELIRKLITAAPCDVILAHGYVRQLPESPASRSLAWFRSAFEWEETHCESRAPALESLFGGSRPGSGDDVVEASQLTAGGDAAEVRLAARVVGRHLNAGVAPNDIAIVVHAAASRYRQLIHETFAAAGIPVDATRRQTVADSGIGNVLLDLLGLAIRPDRQTRETSLSVARSDHVDLSPRDRDVLQRDIINDGFLSLDGWDALALETLGRGAINRINRLKRAVADASASFAKASSPEAIARSVRQLAKDLRLVHNAFASRRRASDRIAAARVIREDNIAWEAITDAMDVTVPAMLEISRSGVGQAGLAYATAWLTLFERALRETPLGAERAPARAVQIRSTGPGCEAPARVTIVLGLIEKVFPRQARQDPFLDDDTRLLLRERYGWDLPISTDTVDRERECFMRGISSATERLYLSYPVTDGDGRPSVRSFFIDDYEALIDRKLENERASTPSAIARLDDAVSTSELMTSISHDVWQYLPRTAESTERRAAALRALEALGRRNVNLAAVRHGRRVTQQPNLNDVLPPTAPHLTLILSASQLKTMGHCTYEHFVEKVLSPVRLQPPEYDAREKGSLIHDAVMEWSTVLDGWNRGEVALPELREWCETKIAKWSPAKRGTERTASATESDLDRLEDLLRVELAALGPVGIARPEYAELAFGDRDAEHGMRHPESCRDAFTLDVATELGPRRVQFRGSLDRVDVVTIGGKRYGVVIDYKTGKTSKYYAADMMDGVDLQLRLYLLVLERFWRITPVGAVYLGFGDGVRRGAIRSDMRDRFAGIEEGPVKLLDRDEWDAFVSQTPELIARLVNRLVELDVRPSPRKKDCKFCGYQPLCRYDRWAPEETNV